MVKEAPAEPSETASTFNFTGIFRLNYCHRLSVKSFPFLFWQWEVPPIATLNTDNLSGINLKLQNSTKLSAIGTKLPSLSRISTVIIYSYLIFCQQITRYLYHSVTNLWKKYDEEGFIDE